MHKKGLDRLAPVYDIVDIPLSKVREKVELEEF
jgi:hypothetical protein